MPPVAYRAMRIPRILSSYLLREVVLYTLIGLLTFVALFVTQELARRLGPLLNAGVTGSDVLSLLGYLLPTLAGYMVPVGFLFGVVVAISRLSSDSEVLAMRACGFGLRHLLVPIVLLSIPVALLTGLLTVEVENSARRNMRGLAREVASRGAFIEPGDFAGIGERVIFVERKNEEDGLEGVVISDRSDSERPFVIFARSGRFRFDEAEAKIHLELFDGDIHFEPKEMADVEYRRISFERFDYPIDASQVFDDAGEIKPREMSMEELRAVIARAERGESLDDLREENPLAYPMQIHRRYALAVTPILFALVGTPLGLRRARGARSWGALVCALLIFAYYALMNFGEYLGESGAVPPELALWIPNAALLLAAVPLIRRNLRGEI